MERYQIAIEELKLLEDKISRHANLAFQNRGWLFALLTALVIGLFDEKDKISSLNFLLISLILTCTFFFMELIQRIPQRQAMARAKEIEEILRNERNYDGPKISISLTLGGKPSDYLKSVSAVVLIPYISIIIIIISLTVINLFSSEELKKVKFEKRELKVKDTDHLKP